MESILTVKKSFLGIDIFYLQNEQTGHLYQIVSVKESFADTDIPN
jgi:hypothetical protein